MERIFLPGKHHQFCAISQLKYNGHPIYITESLITKIHMYGYSCPNCGAEHYTYYYTWESSLNSQRLSAKRLYTSEQLRERTLAIAERDEEAKKVRKSILSSVPFCVVCGEKLLTSTGFFDTSIYKDREFENCCDSFFTSLKRKREKHFLEIAHQEADAFLNTLPQITVNEDATLFEEKSIDDRKKLATYLNYILQTEANESTLRKQLLFLCEEKQKAKLTNFCEIQKASQRLYLNKIRSLYLSTFDTGEDEYCDEITISPIERPDKPIKPTPPKYINAHKPLEPIYEKPGLFNKKRVLAENEIKKERYKRELENYEKAQHEDKEKQKKYQVALDRYNTEMKEYAEECQRRTKMAKLEYEQAVLERERAIEERRKQRFEDIKIAIKEYKATVEKANKTFSNKHQVNACIYLEKEIARCENLLLKTIETKNALYDMNILFPKYRNIVAITHFYEYLISGRVQSLGGPDGAYNLYESEIRSDLIITKLSDVLVSLEEIKENQKVLYQTLNSIDNNVKKLNASINDVVNGINQLNDSSENIVSLLDSIDESSAASAENTATIVKDTQKIAQYTEVSARYAEVTAYYTKKNAEIADAIGFMMALK